MAEKIAEEKKKAGWIPNDLYLEILQVMPRLCVDIVCRCGDEVLLLKRRIDPLKDYWAIPGGRVNKGESCRETAIRKADEELGIKITSDMLRFVGMVNFYHFMRQDIVVTYVVNFTEKPDIVLDYQHREFHWFPFVEVDRFVDAPEFGNRIDPTVVQQLGYAFGVENGITKV